MVSVHPSLPLVPSTPLPDQVIFGGSPAWDPSSRTPRVPEPDSPPLSPHRLIPKPPGKLNRTKGYYLKAYLDLADDLYVEITVWCPLHPLSSCSHLLGVYTITGQGAFWSQPAVDVANSDGSRDCDTGSQTKIPLSQKLQRWLGDKGLYSFIFKTWESTTPEAGEEIDTPLREIDVFHVSQRVKSRMISCLPQCANSLLGWIAYWVAWWIAYSIASEYFGKSFNGTNADIFVSFLRQRCIYRFGIFEWIWLPQNTKFAHHKILNMLIDLSRRKRYTIENSHSRNYFIQ